MRRKSNADAPVELSAGGLDAARLALASPRRRRGRVGRVLLCAALMAGAALALCAAVLDGGLRPAAPPTAEVHEAFRR